MWFSLIGLIIWQAGQYKLTVQGFFHSGFICKRKDILYNNCYVTSISFHASKEH